ncbi:MAG: 50S ribosomal protein L11 methyltransferase [Thermoanaerobaculia bacterium]|nr:50S ribosomal protein L11 methyltransferase [Thermoanaerobaculia bacterium]
MSHSVIQEHSSYVNDIRRSDAWRAALHEVLRGGERVLDLGCGTGILGLLALDAGAGQVVAIDEKPTIELARAIARENSVAGRIEHIRCNSLELDLSERFDLIVSDQLDPMGWEAGLLDVYDDASRRLLRPDGILMPLGLGIYVAGIESSKVYAKIDAWSARPSGISMASVRRFAVNSKQWVKLERGEVLTDERSSIAIELGAPVGPLLDGKADLVVRRAGTLHGIACWFRAALSPSVTVTNSPLSDAAIDRGQAFFAIDSPVDVAEGDVVRTRVRIRHHDAFVAWSVAVFGAGKDTPRAQFSHSTLDGLIAAPESVARLGNAARPAMSLDARRELAILECVQRGGTVKEIEDTLANRTDLFPDRATAARCLGDAIDRLRL